MTFFRRNRLEEDKRNKKTGQRTFLTRNGGDIR